MIFGPNTPPATGTSSSGVWSERASNVFVRDGMRRRCISLDSAGHKLLYAKCEVENSISSTAQLTTKVGYLPAYLQQQCYSILY